MEKKITLPLTDEIINSLRAGDMVYLAGTVYFAVIGGAGALLSKQIKESPINTAKPSMYSSWKA